MNANDDFNLDDLESQPASNPTPADLSGELGLTYNPTPSAQGIEDIYDRHVKKIFVVDVSGSMTDLLFDLSAAKNFNWGPVESAGDIDARIARAEETLSDLEEEEAWIGDENEEEMTKLDLRLEQFPQDNPINDPLWVAMKGMSKQERRDTIVAGPCWNELMLNLDRSSRPTSKRKIDVVKDLAERMASERLDKYPDADIHLVSFGETADHVPVTNRWDLIEQIKKLEAWQGDTKIALAVRKAISICKKAPSPVHSHHIILVTDGLDSNGGSVKGMIPDMQKMGIVLDMIHIAGWHSEGGYEDASSALKEACAATGGEFNVVSRLGDLEVKYLAAGRRLCLPAPSGA